MANFISKVIDKFSPAKPVTEIPDEAIHPGYEKSEPRFIQLGVRTSEEIIWDTYTSGNLLTTGFRCRGKSVTQHVIIRHCLHHSDSWQVKAFSLNKEEFVLYTPQETGHYDLATTVEDGVRLLREVKEMIEERFEIMRKANMRFIDLVPKVQRVLVAIDQIDDLIGTKESVKNIPAEELRLKDEAHELLDYIAANGRVAGVNVVAGAFSHENRMCGQLKTNFSPVIEFGGYSRQNWESFTGEIMPPIGHCGRGYISTDNGSVKFQAYYIHNIICNSCRICQTAKERPHPVRW